MALDNIVTTNAIQLPVSNLFANGQMIVFADGTGKLVRTKSVYVPSEPDDYHSVKYGDRLTSIAFKFYRNKVQLASHYWWVIADANNIKNPLDLTALVGKEIVIPNILNFKLSS